MPELAPVANVRSIETIWIPMADGTRLAGRLWLPADALSAPVPTILEYIPYRRRDGSRDWDQLTHPWLAAQGYACIRLDIRGSGDSDGILHDEYLAQEQDDALEAIAWIADQPWCSGAVGMMGISWGGFNALQVAARRPPALKAIITVCSTDDRYADDIHYMGGSLLNGNLDWGATFFSYMARSPDPQVVGERAFRMWLERLERSEPIYITWMRHQHRDRYWRHGSVCEEYSSIECAVMAVGGWADGYSNAPFRMLEGLSCPRQAIIGPWGHKYPHFGSPGPSIGFLQEAARWWGHWLKGDDNGVMSEPMLRAYLQDSVQPRASYELRSGHWVAEQTWPSASIETRVMHLAPAGLVSCAPDGKTAWDISSPQSTGSEGGEWCPYGLGGLGPELPTDQRIDDGRSLVFDTLPLGEPFAVLGAPALVCDVAADRQVATMTVRLCDVAPDGSSTRVSFGTLNLTHRASHSEPEALEPGVRYRVRVPLNDVGHTFAAGNRVRVSISTAYWPMIWPSPEAVQLTVYSGESRLELPVRQARPEDCGVKFEHPLSTPALVTTVLRAGRTERRSGRDVVTGTTTLEVIHDDGAIRIEETGVTVEHSKMLSYSIRDDDPTSARAEVSMKLTNSEDGNSSSRVETFSVITCSSEAFFITSDLQAFLDDNRIFARSWTETVPRDLI